MDTKLGGPRVVPLYQESKPRPILQPFTVLKEISWPIASRNIGCLLSRHLYTIVLIRFKGGLTSGIKVNAISKKTFEMTYGFLNWVL